MSSRQLQGCSALCVLCAVQIESLLGKKLDSIYEGNASALRVLSVVGPEGFHLRDRAVHVYSEAGRVYAFRDVCKVGLPSLWALVQGHMSGVTGGQSRQSTRDMLPSRSCCLSRQCGCAAWFTVTWLG